MVFGFTHASSSATCLHFIECLELRHWRLRRFIVGVRLVFGGESLNPTDVEGNTCLNVFPIGLSELNEVFNPSPSFLECDAKRVLAQLGYRTNLISALCTGLVRLQSEVIHRIGYPHHLRLLPIDERILVIIRLFPSTSISATNLSSGLE